MSRHRFGTVIVVALGLASGGAVVASMASPTSPPPESAVDFVRDVQPILAVSCVRCHAAALAQGKLRLDTREGLRQGGASGPVRSARRRQGQPALPAPGARRPREAHAVAVGSADRRADRDGAALDRRRGRLAGRRRRSTLASAAPPAASAPRPVAAPSASKTAGGSRLAFNRDVRPILAANCYACHGPDRNNRQMGLRLDREEVAKAPLACGTRRDRSRQPGEERTHPAHHGPRRAEAHAPRLERQGTPEPGPDRHPPALDRGRAPTGSRTGRTSGPSRPPPPDREARRLAPQPGRRLRPRGDREGRPRAVGGGRTPPSCSAASASTSSACRPPPTRCARS